jgi:hypothetical protein
MRIPLPDDRIRIDGAVDVEVVDGGIRPHRLALAHRHEFPIETAFVEAMTSGVRLVLDTDAHEVTLSCTPMRLSLGGMIRPTTFELFVDGDHRSSADADFGHVVEVDIADDSTELTLGDSGDVVLHRGAIDIDGIRTVTVWLPQAAGVEIHSMSVPDGAMVRASAPDTRPRWVHHGSSISHCMEANGPSRTWPAIAAAQTGHQLTNIGLAGQCHVDQFTARTIRDLPADRISLKFGINVVNGDTMRARAFSSAVHGFLDTVRDGHPSTLLLVISPIICPAAESAPGPTVLTDDGRIAVPDPDATLAFGRLSVGRIRELLVEVVEQRRAVGDDALHYLDGRELFGAADLADLPDGLHPNGDGYERMGERIAARQFLLS